MKIFAFIVYSITNVSNVRNIGLPHEFLVLTELVEFFLINPAETNFFFGVKVAYVLIHDGIINLAIIVILRCEGLNKTHTLTYKLSTLHNSVIV